MPIESAEFVSELNVDNPFSDDLVQEGDNHLRMIKVALKNTFPNANRACYDPRVTAINANTVLTVDANKRIYEINAGPGEVVVTLPALLEENDGWSVAFIKIDASENLAKIKAASGGILAQTDIQLAGQHEIVELYWSGAAWRSDQRSYRQFIKTRARAANPTTLTYSDFGILQVFTHAVDTIVHLPALTGFSSAVIGIKHAGTAGKKLTLNPNGSQLIDGEGNYVISDKGDVVWIVSSGTQWEVFSFTAGSGFGPSQINTWTATQIFNNASLVEYEQTLTVVNEVVAWNHDKGNHAKILIDEADDDEVTFSKPSNMRVGQRGLLRISVDGEPEINFNSVFFFIGGDPELESGTVTIFEYFVSASDNIYIWRVTGGGGGGYTDYDKGVPSNGGSYSQNHGLGKLPSAVTAYLKCVTAANGYAVDDMVAFPASPVGDNDRGGTISFNETVARIQLGNGTQAIYPNGSGNAVIISHANYHLILRVHN